MRVAILSESEYDERAVRILIEGILGSSTETLERLKPLGKCIRYGDRELSHVLGCSSSNRGAQHNFLLKNPTYNVSRNDAIWNAIQRG
jgi:hypothetical protein